MLFIQKYPHIFKIKAEDGQVIPFEPNIQQIQLLKLINSEIKDKGKARIIVVKPRQLGFTTLMQLLALSFTMSEPAFNAYTMAHDSTTATDIFEQKIKFAFDNLPEKFKNLYKVKRDNTRQLMFDDEMMKATLTVGTSARGTTQNLLHISEAGKMSMNGKLWNEMIEGSLPASEQAKIIIIESTADGGKGKFYDMVQNALAGNNEFKVFFPSWTNSPKYQLETPTNEDWKDKYYNLAKKYNLSFNPIKNFGLNPNQWFWYYKRIVLLGLGIKSQYPLSLEEAFDQPIEGSYYQDLIDQVIEDNRVSENVKYNPSKLVDTYWDLAVSHDLNATIFVQVDGDKINIIDYYEKTGVGASVIANDLMAKGYLYGRHFAPHDVTTRQIDETALRTKQDIFRSVGINFIRIGKTSVASGVEAVRLLFPKFYFAKNDNVTLFLNRLRAYRYESIGETGLAKEVHDINSHASDSIRLLAVSVKLNQSSIYTTSKATILKVKR